MEKKIPVRTCIVCKEPKEKKQLNRIVNSTEGIKFDPTGRLNGRGAYVCSNPECIKKLKKTKALNRAFSMPVSDEVYDKVTEEILSYVK